jgi:hypothetical protein
MSRLLLVRTETRGRGHICCPNLSCWFQLITLVFETSSSATYVWRDAESVLGSHLKAMTMTMTMKRVSVKNGIRGFLDSATNQIEYYPVSISSLGRGGYLLC